MAAHPFLENPVKHLLIGGQWTQPGSGTFLESRNPANGDLLATVADADAEDVDRAVIAARTAFDGAWAERTPADRQMALIRLADLVEKNGDDLARLDTLDMGSPLWRTQGSIGLIASILRYNAGLARTVHGTTPNISRRDMFAATIKEPMGVCAAIIPWNSPAWSAVLNIAPALAAGCTIIVKPAEDGSLSPLLLGQLCLEAGIPSGVVNIVTGRGATAGAALALHPGIDKISFTGSTATGRMVLQSSAGNFKRVSLELGGKSPNIIFDDADLEKAAATAVLAAFGNSGQVCSAGSRLFVQRSVADDFAARVVRISSAMRIGDGLTAGSELGPLVSGRQLARVIDYVQSARREGATVMSGGSRLEGDAWDNGFFFAPTVLSNCRDEMTVVREEVFGPVVSLLPFDEEAEVVARANASPYGLGAGVWTRDMGRAQRMSRALQAGSIWVNCYNILDPAVPSGGYKASGIGREYGEHHIEEFLQTKSVWMDGT
ncbi:MAG TPA: aldehyde dehydrogenase family protein [Sphingomonas sp.]|nr:aldehyde dehydrogenase family protein [Sphingomonas sp.]